MQWAKIFIPFFLSIQPFTAKASWPDPVDDFDVKSYMGRWYEVASTKPLFQLSCVCVTAEYEIMSPDRIKVVNTCRRKDVGAEPFSVRGLARQTQEPGVFRVGIGFPAFFNNYFVVDLAEDYSWAAVSGPFRRTLWILSRTPTIPQETYQSIVERLSENGYAAYDLEDTVQENCPTT